MCVFCAAIPATAAMGAKLNADKKRHERLRTLPIVRLTTVSFALLVIASALYHTLISRN